MTQEREGDSFGAWAIVELMGHRKLAGYVSEEQHFGVTMLRIDVPKGNAMTTQFYGGSAIYCVTPTTEKVVRAFAAKTQPKPVYSYELDELKELALSDEEDDVDLLLTGDNLPF